MTRPQVIVATLAVLFSTCSALAQSPGTLYTWAGTGDIADWASSGTNLATLANATAGQLTVTEMGDELDPSIKGGALVIRDGFNRRLEASTAQGGLDVTGLDALEVDLQHNGTGPVNVQFFIQATPAFNYLWAGNNGALNGPDWSVGTGVQTLRFPINLLTPEQQAYIRTLGLSVRDHSAQGNLTWQILDVRKVGPGATSRVLASHNTGSPENGMNGVFVNFEAGAIVGNDGSQNQSGLSQVTNAGVGSLQWTDRGGAGTAESPSGAAIGWVNGTSLFVNGSPNTFNQRLADFSNYNTVTFRMSATDALNAGGELGVQAYFQTGPGYTYQTTGVGVNGNLALPIDGQYHDVTFPLGSVTSLFDVEAFGINLAAHTNELQINVDYVRFDKVAGVAGDYNNNGVVDAADYVLWRNGGPLQNEVDTPGTVNAADYTAWRARFGNTTGSGSLTGAAVPEPANVALLFATVCGVMLYPRQRG
ncbi:MAG: hypothetical protein U0805_01820 [Pirellulales bacterium]